MKLQFKFLIAVLVVASLPLQSVNAQQPSDGGSFYYQLGGGEPISRAPNRSMTTSTLGANVSWGNTFSCGGTNFDPMQAVTNQLNGATQGFQNLQSSVISAATGAVASLPGLILARVNPDLYDLLQKGIMGAKTDISFSQASCEDMQNIMQTQGQGFDFEKWVKVSAYDDWRNQQQTQPDIIQAKQTVDQNVGNSGAAWIGGAKAGGVGQPPIQINRDVVAAGFNLLLNRPASDATAVPATSPLYPTPLVTAWQTPAQASQWSVDVLGDSVITTCETCPKKQGIPGKGLVFKYEEEKNNLAPLVQNLVSGTTPLTTANLQAISVPPSLMITPDVIKGIQEEGNSSILVGRLSSEIALARTLERAIHLKRMLQAGKRETTVAANGVAQDEIVKLLSDLKSETDGLMEDMEIRDKIASNTPEKLLERMMVRRKNTSTREYAPNQIKNGARN